MPKTLHAPKKGVRKISVLQPQSLSVNEELFLPGDFIFPQGKDFIAKLIRFGQRLRFKKEDAKYAKYGHCAIIISPQGDLIEATSQGIKPNHINNYKTSGFTLVNIDSAYEDRVQAVNFARSCLGQEYGYLTIASLVLTVLTGGKLNFGFEGQNICSGLVAKSLERTQAIFPVDSGHIMPAMLAKYYEIE